MTPDPVQAGNAVSLPSNWNKYAYVGGDTVNKNDPAGLCSPQDNPPCYSVDSVAYAWPAGGGGGGGVGRRTPTVTLVEWDEIYQKGPVPNRTAWDFMKDAASLAEDWLKDDPECQQLFGTEESRKAGFDPATILKAIYSKGGSPYGGTAFVPMTSIGPAAVTSVAPTLLPGNPAFPIRVAVVIKRTTWNLGDIWDNALTLLHELGHVYDYLQPYGSGGSQLTTPDWFSSGGNDAKIASICTTTGANKRN